MNKQQLSQFYTKNASYILQGLNIPDNVEIIEPFCGNGDLIKWSKKHCECFDLEPKIQGTIQQDVLLNPPNYENKFVLTNPPFKNKNKNKDKTIYNQYQVDDLYKAFLKTLIIGKVFGGILILPLNFLCEENDVVRTMFLLNFSIQKLNIFHEAVFEDTKYSVCSFLFVKGEQKNSIPTIFFPENKSILLELKKEYGFRPGGEIYTQLHKNTKPEIQIGRLVEGESTENKHLTNLTLRATDTGKEDGKIKLFIHEKPFIGKKTERILASLWSNVEITNEETIVKLFNDFLNENREKYNSLFLTHFRDASNCPRKRISFDFSYKLLKSFIIENKFYSL